MKLRSRLAFAFATCVAALASAGTPKSVDVPPGDLTDAVELLANRYEVDVIYPGDLLKGQTTQGIHGTFQAVEAFGKLLEGTSFVLSKEGDALLISRLPTDSRPPLAQLQQTPARALKDGLPNVVIKAGVQSSQKREPTFGWARHDAERRAMLAEADERALGSKCQRLARRGDEKIQLYCTVHGDRHPSERTAVASPTLPNGTSCRRTTKPGSDKVETFCGDPARWEEFDTWAIGAKVTCRQAATSQELCLSATQWGTFDSFRVAEGGSNWPAKQMQGDSSWFLYSPLAPDRMTTPACGCR